jgi:DNA-binding CsgD family transcriptional regulator
MRFGDPTRRHQAPARIGANSDVVLKAQLAELPRLGTVEAPQNGPGVVLADLGFKPIYTNATTLQILSYPYPSHTTANPEVFVRGRIRSILQAERFTTVSSATDFLSGRRRYVCRPFLLTESKANGTGSPIVVLLLERRSRDPMELSEVSRRFHLSPREVETVQHLVRGLTTKEVAQRMSVSPNTVKQFVRLVMSKMGVSTRSGIIGRILNG